MGSLGLVVPGPAVPIFPGGGVDSSLGVRTISRVAFVPFAKTDTVWPGLMRLRKLDFPSRLMRAELDSRKDRLIPFVVDFTTICPVLPETETTVPLKTSARVDRAPTTNTAMARQVIRFRRSDRFKRVWFVIFRIRLESHCFDSEIISFGRLPPPACRSRFWLEYEHGA